MGNINNQMQKIISFTSNLIGAVNYKSIGCNVPVDNFLTILGVDNALEFGSLQETKTSIQQIKGAIAQGANMVNCAWTLMTTSQGLDFLSQIATGALGAISSVIDQIWDAVAVQIHAAINQVVGTFLNLVQAFQSLITSVLLLADAIVNFFSSLSQFADMTFKLKLEQKQCADFYASIAACLLNKYLGPYLDEFTNKVISQVNDLGGQFNALLYQELQDVNTFSSYAKQEAFLLKKASLQINGLTPRNLLG